MAGVQQGRVGPVKGLWQVVFPCMHEADSTTQPVNSVINNTVYKSAVLSSSWEILIAKVHLCFLFFWDKILFFDSISELVQAHFSKP